MFDVGPGEFFTIALIALIVFGPQRLPDIARKIGGYIAEVRKAAGDLRAGLDEEVRQIQEPLEELKTDLTKPVSEIRKTLEETSSAITREVDEVAKAAETELSGRRVEWIAPEPTSGVKPNEAWDGMKDSAPEGSEPDEANAEISADVPDADVPDADDPDVDEPGDPGAPDESTT